MNIEDILRAEFVLANVRATSKKQILQSLSQRWAVLHGVEPRLALDKLLERERLGSTGVGRGIAIPHARIKGINSITGVFAQLSSPVDFDAVDDMPVDLVFMLFAPQDAGADHLKALARVSRLLRDVSMCDKLRQTANANALYALLTDQPSSHAA